MNRETEQLLTMAEAARSLPARRAGRPTHPSTIYRWTVGGCRGVVLEHIDMGTIRMTSREALDRFFEATTAKGKHHPSQPSKPQPRKRTSLSPSARRA